MVAELGSELVPLVVDGERLEGLRTTNRFPPAIWYRTFLPDLLSDAARVVYLDCDTLVLGDIADLAGVELDGCAIGAVHNVSLGNDADVARAGLTDGVRYFNSGVLVLDLDAWRRDGIAERVRAEARSAPNAPFPDQDALNAVLAHRRQPLSPRWNVQNTVWSLDYGGGGVRQGGGGGGPHQPAARPLRGLEGRQALELPVQAPLPTGVPRAALPHAVERVRAGGPHAVPPAAAAVPAAA